MFLRPPEDHRQSSQPWWSGGGRIVSGTGTPKMTIFGWVSGLAVRRHWSARDDGYGKRPRRLGRDRAAAGVTDGVSEADASLIPGRGVLLLHVAVGW